MRNVLFGTWLTLAAVAGPAGAQTARPPGDSVYDGKPLRAWVAQLADPVPQDRIRAAYAIAGVGPAAGEAVPALGAMLRDEMPVARYAAAWALGEIGPAAAPAVPALEGALHDRVGDVRWVAAKALRKIRRAPAAARSDPPVPAPVRTPAGTR
jgi:HEAT repeat protein